jgi:hypothetical protein
MLQPLLRRVRLRRALRRKYLIVVLRPLPKPLPAVTRRRRNRKKTPGR